MSSPIDSSQRGPGWPVNRVSFAITDRYSYSIIAFAGAIFFLAPKYGPFETGTYSMDMKFHQPGPYDG